MSPLALEEALGTHTLYMRCELNRMAEAALGNDDARILATMNTGVASPVDPTASLSKQGSIFTFTPIESETERHATVMYDYLYSGWMRSDHRTQHRRQPVRIAVGAVEASAIPPADSD